MTKQIPVCYICGSDRVLADAYAKWDQEESEWVLSTEFETNAVCNECGGETKLDWVEANLGPAMYGLMKN